jgi:hypothetical protein
LVSQVCVTAPLHCSVPGEHEPAHAPPVQTVEHAAPVAHVPVASQVCGENPSHCRVSGTHPPMQAPSLHTKGHVSMRIVLTRSTPHSIASLPWQKRIPPASPSQTGTIV